MIKDDKELEKEFNDADIEDYLDKKTICVGLGIKLSLLNSKAIHGGGPMHIKECGKLLYKKGEAIQWYVEYWRALQEKKLKLKKAIFSMANNK